MERRWFSYVVRTLGVALLAFLVMSCARDVLTPTAPRTPAASSTPTPQPTPTATPPPPAPVPALTPSAGAPDPNALLPYLPAEAQVAGSLRAQLDGDEPLEVVALLGFNGTGNGLGYKHLELMVLELDRPPGQAVAWQSGKLVGERGEALQVRDINGDGRDEVLSYQSMGAAGYTLYVVGWRDGAFGLLRPGGGYFDGKGYFGDVGVRLEDLDRNGTYEILASYGPAGTSTDVYQWDGKRYTYAITLHDK